MSKLDNAFDMEEHKIDIVPVAGNTIQTVVLDHENESDQEDVDAKYTRQNQIDLIEVSKAAVNTAMKIAVETENPRAIETLAMMIKTASEVNRQLVLQIKDKAEAKSAKSKSGGNVQSGTITNNTIVMSGKLSDITELLKKQKLEGGS